VRHPEHPVTILAPDEAEGDLVWNVAIGIRRPDAALQQAINAAIDRLSADGTIARIYSRYGVILQPPK
jgi:polar amino acid transport system substrate-binding protein